jgi:hypothetical protein
MRVTGIRRFTILSQVLVLLAIISWSLMNLPDDRVERPYVLAEATRCVRPDGEPIGQWDQKCPPGTTAETVVVKSHRP